MTDQIPSDETPAGIDRRTMLKRGAIVGGALVWTTPVVQSIASPAFAQTSPGPGNEGQICPDGQSRTYVAKFDFPDDAGAGTPATPGLNENGTCFSGTTLPDQAPGGVVLDAQKTAPRTATITLASGFDLVSAGVKVGEGNSDEACITVTQFGEQYNAANCSTTFTVTVSQSEISNITFIISGCPVTCPAV